jgi:hypothetical protein
MVLFEFLKHTYEHPCRDVSLAIWKKYPSPARPDVLSVDILRRDFDPETGVLRTRRLLTMKMNLPLWLEKIAGDNVSRTYFLEDAVIDPRNNTMTLVGRNISFKNLIEVEETCIYTPHKNNNNWTFFEQNAKVTAFPWGVARKIEEFFCNSFTKNALKGREIMEDAIARVKQEYETNMKHVDDFTTKLKQEADELSSKIMQQAEELGSKIKREADAGLAAISPSKTETQKKSINDLD